nr:MAG TPA: chitin synthase regulator [Caudoviricetes sp.]
MAVVVEASALCWGFFCVIMILVLRIAFIGRRRP